MKKFFIISSIFLFCALVLLGVYLFAFKSKEAPTKIEFAQPVEAPKEETKSEVKKGKIYAITEEKVISPTLNADKDRILYYSGENGNAIEITLDGESKARISRDTIEGMVEAIWSPERNKAVVHTRIEGKDRFFLNDLDQKTTVELKEGLDSVAWTNLGDKIIYKYYDSATNQRSLNIADPDGSNWKKLSDINSRFVSLASVPQSAQITFWNSQDGQAEGFLKSISAVGGESETLFSGKFGADFRWSPKGTKILTSFSTAKNSQTMSMAVLDRDGKNIQELGIPTLLEKTVWSLDNKTVYYALPGAIADGSVMPNDYLTKKIMTADTFWKVDIETGKKERLVELEEIKDKFDARELLLSSNEDSLFFVNRYDSRIYKIEL